MSVAIQDTAFAKYLLSLHPDSAVSHFRACLMQGNEDNLAWEVWEEVHGDKGFRNGEIEVAIQACIDHLKATVET